MVQDFQEQITIWELVVKTQCLEQRLKILNVQNDVKTRINLSVERTVKHIAMNVI